MSKRLNNLARKYSLNLRRFAARKREDVLAQAYGLGRAAIANGLGVLDMARVHQSSLSELLLSSDLDAKRERTLSTAESFFLESLAPFEATHRGFQETNVSLQQAVAELRKRNLDLAVANRRLTAEIRERKRIQDTLRESREHYRRLFQQAKVMQQNLRDLSDKILHAQEEERTRISRELHDETSQALTVISIMLASLKQDEPGSTAQHQRLQNAQELLQDTMASLHDFARDLRPPSLDGLGLLPALHSWLDRFAKRTGLRVSFRADAITEKLDDNQKTALYRITQETLTNILKHARASRVDLLITHAKGRLTLEISNDGKSFRPARNGSRQRSERLGLLGMQERVRLIKGELAIEPRRRNGTIFRVTIPFDVPLIDSQENCLCRNGTVIPHANGATNQISYETNPSAARR